MTPEEIARHILRPGSDVGARVRAQCAPPLVEDLTQAIAFAVSDAVREEREGCARVAESQFDVYNISYCIAQDIRRRA